MSTLDQCDDPECYADIRSGFGQIIRNGYQSAPSPQVVVDAVYKAITARNTMARYTAGQDVTM